MNNMITEQQLKDRCTPDIIKRMVELAEGFEYVDEYGGLMYFNKDFYSKFTLINNPLAFSTLIHRTCEGINNLDIKKGSTVHHSIQTLPHFISRFNLKGWVKDYRFKNYQPQSLTQTECATLHCLLDIFDTREEEK